MIIYLFNNKMNTPLLHLSEIKKDGMMIEDMKSSDLTFDLLYAAYRQNPNSISKITEGICADSFLAYIIHKDGKALRYIPQDKRTTSLCLMAVQQNRDAMKYVDKENIEICLLYVR